MPASPVLARTVCPPPPHHTQGRDSRLVVGFMGCMSAWSSLAEQLEGCEEEVGLLADEDSKQVRGGGRAGEGGKG